MNNSFLKVILIFIYSHLGLYASAQLCITTPDPVKIIYGSNAGNPQEKKTVRVNVHYFLRSNGTGFFSETGDNLGNSFSGYDFAKDIIVFGMNSKASWNEQMKLPPGNSTSKDVKNYRFVLDAVYFHRNDNCYDFGKFCDCGSGPVTPRYECYKMNPDSVMQVFLTDDPNDLTPGGYASNVSLTSLEKYTENNDYYDRYKDYLINGNLNALTGSLGQNTGHELLHLLGLSHTTRWNWGPLCPTNPPNLSCDDGCADTPTAWDMEHVCGHHPSDGLNCPWGNALNCCTNNYMDYNTGGNALTPCQIGIIHNGLANGLKQFRLCSAVATNSVINLMEYPQFSYYGKEIDIYAPTLADNGTAEIYFSEDVEFIGSFEASGDSDFEVFHVAACP